MNEVYSFLRFIVGGLFLIGFSLSAQDTNSFDEQGLRHGIWIGEYPNGAKKYQGQFEHGLETGVFVFYDIRGIVANTRTFITPGRKCTLRTFDYKGNLSSIGTIVDRKKEGKWVFFNPSNSDTLSTEHYKNGRLHGVKQVFFDNGTLATHTEYFEGKKHGQHRDYYSNDTLQYAVTYNQDSPEGIAQWFFRNGQLKRKGSYEDGERDGEWLEYTYSGDLYSKKIFR